ncbi:MAG TPA: glycosyltransferase [Candidatus Udaeobacter sp.]|nr:glycosyltransferase [Candidatus Udaeobacter sp.]
MAPARPPSAPETPLTILCFGYHPWSPSWKRNQSLAAALAARPGVERVRFINPPVTILTPPRRLLTELHGDHRHRWRGVMPYRPRPKITVMTPFEWLPFRSRFSALARADRRLQRGDILGPLADRPFVLYVNGVREETAELEALVHPLAELRVFDWSDDFAQFPVDQAAQARIAALTAAEIRQADLVLAVNDTLAERARGLGARVETVLNASGLQPIPGGRPLTAGALALASELARPVVGYAGYINAHRVDADLVRELARRHPDWTVLFLGLIQLEFDRHFQDLPNVRFHPLVPHEQLADYLAIFDVCLIPHLDNAHTAGNNPLKLYDYLTTGKPIVSTRIAGETGFEDVVTVAADREAFIRAVEAAVATPISMTEAAAHRSRAAAHTWEARAAQVEAAIRRALAAKAAGAAPAAASAERPGKGR